MCAITGFTSFLSRPHDEQFVMAFIKLLSRSRARGRDGFGYVGFLGRRNTAVAVQKWIPPNEPDLYDIEVADAIANSVTFMANHRAEPTTEFVPNKRKEDQQPYQVGDIWCVHNGVIANDKELFRQYGLVRPDPMPPLIDSWAIPYLVAKEGIHNALKLLKGSMATAIYDTVGSMLYLYRNYKPLHLYWNDQAEIYVFSSFGMQATEHGPGALEGFPGVWREMEFPPYTLISGLRPTDYFSHTERRQNKDRAVVICSGGLDSTTAAKIAVSECSDVTLLHFAYGCMAQEKEILAVGRIAHAIGAKAEVIDMSWLKTLGGSPLTENKPVARGFAGAEFAHEWVPARNTAMIGVAAAWCDRYDVGRIYLGLNLEEGGAYPDNTGEFYQGFNKVLDCGTQARPQITNPLANLMKKEIVELALKIGAPIHLSWSCYYGRDQQCGECGPCSMRRQAFRMLGKEDMIRYADATAS
jgi:7-cyano-7-deazaguanine synthase